MLLERGLALASLLGDLGWNMTVSFASLHAVFEKASRSVSATPLFQYSSAPSRGRN